MRRRIEALELIYEAKVAEKVDREECRTLFESLTSSGWDLADQD